MDENSSGNLLEHIETHFVFTRGQCSAKWAQGWSGAI
jgi:hypothetical protein